MVNSNNTNNEGVSANVQADPSGQLGLDPKMTRIAALSQNFKFDRLNAHLNHETDHVASYLANKGNGGLKR